MMQSREAIEDTYFVSKLYINAICCKIDDRAVATDVENSVVIFFIDIRQFLRGC